MTADEYLEEILNDQTLSGKDEELEDLRKERDKVEGLLRNEFGNAPIIKYGGSKAKHTMVKASFDLDILCYFPGDDESAGGTLEEIYNSISDVLLDDYIVDPKRSALRLLDPESKHYAHVDVVPGRFVDGTEGDVYLHQKGADKERLKTNPKVHIEHIRESGLRKSIKLGKIWRYMYNFNVKTFILEIVVIEVLSGREETSLSNQMVHLFETIRDDIEDISIEDPANRQGNDLSNLFTAPVKKAWTSAARRALTNVENDDWEQIFGSVEKRSEREKAESLKSASASATGGSKPWNDSSLV